MYVLTYSRMLQPKLANYAESSLQLVLGWKWEGQVEGIDNHNADCLQNFKTIQYVVQITS